MIKYLKIKKKMWTLVVSYPENHNSRRKTAIMIKFHIKRKKKHSLIVDSKLQVDQIKRKIEAKFNMSLVI